MNYDEAPSWLQAANQHAVASDNTSLFDDISIALENAPRFLGVSLASGLNSFYNTGIAVGNVFKDEEAQMEYNDTKEWISSYDEDLGKYYSENQSAADLTGFVVSSFVPGLGAVKGLNMAQKAARAAAAGNVGSNFAKATNLFAPAMETFVKREAADLAAKQATFSFAHANSLKALAAGTTQGVLEGVAFETAVMATMFKSPILDDMDAGDLVKNAMFGVVLGGAAGAIGAAGATWFGVGKLLKGADLRAKPFTELSTTLTSREMLASDAAVLAAQDIERISKIQATPEYVLAQKKAAGETGESLLPNVVEAEVASLTRLKESAIMDAQNKYRTVVRSMSEDDVLGNTIATLTNKMGADDTMRLMFQSQEFVRAGSVTKLEQKAKELVKSGQAKTLADAKKSLLTEATDMHIVLHSGNIGEQISGKVGYLRLADEMSPQQLERHLVKNSYKSGSKMDYRQKLDPREMETRWMAARRSTIPFPKGYVFNSHDLPALEKALRMGLDEIKVDVGGDIKTLASTDAIREHLMISKGEVLMAQMEYGRNTDVMEVITDIRKDFIEGTVSKKTPAAGAEDAFFATESYKREYAQFLGKDPAELRVTDFDVIPKYAKVTYSTKEVMGDDGMLLKGMALIKEREKLAKGAVQNYFASYTREMAELFPEISEDLLRSVWRGEGGAGLVTNAGGSYGSMASMASYIGNLVAELSKTRIGALTEDISGYAQKLLESPQDAIRFSTINAMVSNTTEKYVLDELGESLIPYKLKQWMDEGQTGSAPVINGPDEIPLESEVIREVVAKHIALNDARNAHWSALHAVQGNPDGKLAGVFRPIRPDPRDYKHVAFVKDPTIVGAGHTQMLFAKDAAQLESMISEVNKIGKYKVFTKQQSEDFYRAMGEWDFDKTLHENYVNVDLQSKGIMSNFFPATDPQKVVNEWLRGEVRAENTLLRETVLTKYEKEIKELKRLAGQWDQTRGSRVGTRTVDELLTSPSDKNPYIGLMKSMMNVTKIEEMPIWLRTANESLDAIVSRAWDSASNVLRQAAGKGVTQAEVDKVNEIFEEVGFKSSYSIAAQELANASVPRGVLSTFVRTANAFLTTTMLRMDAFNAVTNLVGQTVMFAPELKAVIKDIQSNSTAVGELARISQIKVPGVTDTIFSPSKLIAETYKRIHGPEGALLREEYKKRGLLPDLTDQYFKSLDAMTLTGKETVGDMTTKTGKIKESLTNFANKAEQWTGNKFAEQFNRLVAVDAMKQITEVAVKHGMMDEKAAWMYVNTFSNRVNGVIRAAERPLMFQGPIGQAMGLFQSYQLNLMQQLFRNVGEGRGKTLAMMAGLQGSIFGASSLPGFNLINNNLIAQAAGNPEHYDLHSATRLIFGQEGADWLMYGAPSNVLRASLYTRGDTNPRTWHVVPNPTNPGDLPFVSAFAKVFSSVKDATSKIADGASLWEGLLSGIEHMGISRPLAGIAAVGRAATSDGMQVISTQKNGNIAGSNDLFSWSTLVRVAGAKPLDESIVTNNYFRINAYREADREKREVLATNIKAQLVGGGEISAEEVGDFARRYAESGGSQTGFNQFWMNNYKNANVTQSQQMVQKLDNPYARRMQEVMGGRESLFDTDSY